MAVALDDDVAYGLAEIGVRAVGVACLAEACEEAHPLPWPFEDRHMKVVAASRGADP